jgi:hypothetical protein
LVLVADAEAAVPDSPAVKVSAAIESKTFAAVAALIFTVLSTKRTLPLPHAGLKAKPREEPPVGVRGRPSSDTKRSELGATTSSRRPRTLPPGQWQ